MGKDTAKIAITCSAPRCHEIVEHLRFQNIHAYAAPLLKIQDLNSAQPKTPCDAMLLTSRHAVTDALPELPVIAVGAQTAKMAQDYGYYVIQTGHGGVHDLDLSPYDNILYPCALQPTFIPENATPWPIYETIENPDFLIEDNTETIAVFSVKAARILKSFAPALSSIQFLCLSQAIADVLCEFPADSLAVCRQPDYDAMEQLIFEVCKK